MWILARNLSVFAVFALLGTYVWLFGGSRGEFLVPTIPWVAAFLAEVLLFFPQQHVGETTYEARERVWNSLASDPMKTVIVFLAILLLVPFFNTGLCRLCDAQAIANGAEAAPKIPFIPFCVNRMHHLNTVLWYVPTFLAVLVAKHSLLRRGKRMLMELVVWNGFLLAALGFAQQMTGAEGPLWIAKQSVYFFSVFGYPNMAGDYFTTLFALSVAVWRWRIDEAREIAALCKLPPEPDCPPLRPRNFLQRHYMAVPAALFFVSTLATLCRASMLIILVLTAVFALHAFVCLFFSLTRVQRVKASAITLLFLVASAFSAYLFVPESVQKELATVDVRMVLGRVSGKSEYHSRVAANVWKDHLLFGCGGWGYSHFQPQYMTKEDYKHYYANGAINVHNDSLQILAEHGAIGFGLMLAVMLMLLKPIFVIWKALYANTRFMSPKERPPRPVQLFVLPAPAFCILTGALATYVHSFGECPFRSPAIFSLFFLSVACVEGYLPKLRARD